MFRITFLLLFISLSASAQKVYTFDHVLEYDYRIHPDSLPEMRLILTNSKANHYNVEVSESEDGSYHLELLDREGIQATAEISKTDFYKAETFNIPCNQVWRYRNPFKFRTEEYSYSRIKDIMLGEHKYEVHELRHEDEEVERENNFGRLHFIMEKDTEYHLPVLLHGTAYEEWKKEGSLPNGVFRTRYMLLGDQTIDEIYSLQKIHKIRQYISIDERCDYTQAHFWKNKE